MNSGLPLYRRNPVLRVLGSIWLGIVLLAGVLVYSSIFSAVAPARWALEMTEMQAFQHWLFVGLSAAFAASLLVIVFFRSRWTLTNAGSLLTHIGLILLIGGALTYFGSKIEGDVLLESPRIDVRLTAGDRSTPLARIPATTDTAWGRMLPHRNEPLFLTVLETRPANDVAVGEADIEVRLGSGAARTVTLRNDDDAWQPVEENTWIRLTGGAAQTKFYDDERPALYVRNLSKGTQSIRPIDTLPIYRERYVPDGEPLRDTRGVAILPTRARPEWRLLGMAIPTGWFERWRMPINVDMRDLPFDVRITGYTPFVEGFRAATDANGDSITIPVLTPHGERRMNLSARSMSAIRIKITGRDAHADWELTRWVPFSMYPDEAAVRSLDFIYPGDKQRWQLVYSRFEHHLNATLAANNLWVEHFPGERGIQSYHSTIRVDDGERAYATTVETNQTIAVGRWTLFQSGFASDRWSYSILGVGNRYGILPMNAGWILISIGCVFAFYIKPLLLRRARAAVSSDVTATFAIASEDDRTGGTSDAA